MTKHQKQIEMFRASAQSYRDEIDSGLYTGIPVAQMSAQAITWDEAADSLENMYLLDSTPTHIENFERDLGDVVIHHQENIGLCETLGVFEAIKHELLTVAMS